MILINLLPHREVARRVRRDEFHAHFVAAALLGVALSGLNYLWFQSQIAAQQQRNKVLQDANIQFDSQIKDLVGIESEIKALLARQRAVEDLQADRNLPVLLLADLAKQLPNGVYITSLVQEDLNVTLKGVAQSNERVSEFLKNLGDNSALFSKPELDEILAGMVNVTPVEQRRAANFTIRVRLVRGAQEASPPATVKPGE